MQVFQFSDWNAYIIRTSSDNSCIIGSQDFVKTREKWIESIVKQKCRCRAALQHSRKKIDKSELFAFVCVDGSGIFYILWKSLMKCRGIFRWSSTIQIQAWIMDGNAASKSKAPAIGVFLGLLLGHSEYIMQYIRLHVLLR